MAAFSLKFFIFPSLIIIIFFSFPLKISNSIISSGFFVFAILKKISRSIFCFLSTLTIAQLFETSDISSKTRMVKNGVEIFETGLVKRCTKLPKIGHKVRYEIY